MIKKYFMFTHILNNYGSIARDNQGKEFSWLSMLFLSLNPYNDFIFVDCEEFDHNIITIQMHFPGDDDDEYGPDSILRLSRENYKYIAQQWDKVIAQRPKYFVLSRDDNGWIDLELKNELSQQDLQCVNLEKMKKLS